MLLTSKKGFAFLEIFSVSLFFINLREIKKDKRERIFMIKILVNKKIILKNLYYLKHGKETLTIVR